MAVDFQKGRWSLHGESFAPGGFFALRTTNPECGCLTGSDFRFRDSLNTSLHTIGRACEIVSAKATPRQTPSHCRIHSPDPALPEDRQ
jgi:hypothetical protein